MVRKAVNPYAVAIAATAKAATDKYMGMDIDIPGTENSLWRN